MPLNECVKKVAFLTYFPPERVRLSTVFLSCILLFTSAEASVKPASSLSFTKLSTINNNQQDVITGRVVNSLGEPIVGVLITVKGTGVKSSTTENGIFSIRGKVGDQLVLTHMSYYAKTEIISKVSNVVIAMEQDNNLLDQVVVTGYTDYSKNKSSSASTTVGAADINQVPMSSLDQILQGRVPGLSVSSSSGQPGQSASVVIRGVGSINGSTTPLYVMDGVPIESGYFQTINPADIESMNVLKDASAKALYGSRGSNGVILITTKKGKQGQLNVHYSSQYGFSTLTQPTFEMMDTRERLRFEEEVGLETGRDIGPGWAYSKRNPQYGTKSNAWQEKANQTLDSLGNINTDWRDMFFQHGRFMEQQVSLSGGNENVRTYNSFGLWQEEGIVRETGLDRYSLRSNTNFNYGKFSAGINLNLGYSKSKFTYNEGGTGVGSPMASVYYALPYEYPYTADGVFHASDALMPFLDNREGSRGIDVLYGASDKTDQLKALLAVNLAYQITDNLKFITRGGIDLRNSTDQVFINPASYIGSKQTGLKGSFGEGSRRNFGLSTTSGLTYSKTIDIHDFEVSGFFEYIYNDYKSFSYKGYGVDDRLLETPAGITVSPTFLPSIQGSRSSNALVSYMGVARYTLMDRYTLTGSYRYDGASLSAVPLKNRWHGFYSFGAAWDVKREAFLKDIDFIPVLRLRSSYGQTASPFSNGFSYLPVYSVGTSYGGLPGLKPRNVANPDFDWEYVNEFNAGFDLSLFRTQRIKFSLDWYNRITQNMFIEQPVSFTAGAETKVAKLSTGKMRNRGVELSLSGDIIQTKDFNWNVGVNMAYNKNVILHVTDLADELREGDARIIKVGLPYGTYYATQWAGVDPATGDPLYYDREGKITTVYSKEEQAVPLGVNMFPKITGGITTSFSWKDLSMSALFSFVSDVSRWNNIDFYNENERYMTSNQSKRMLYDRWKKPGDVTTLQRIDAQRNFTSKDIQDASFMRLRNLKVNYNVPVRSLLNTSVIKSINVFVQGENLFTWTKWRGLDPENSRQYGRFEYPNARKYTAGISVNF